MKLSTEEILMHPKFLTLTFALVVTCVSAEAFAQDFDISGIQIGMTPSEAEAVSIENGYVPKNQAGRKTHTYPGLSYRQLIEQKQGTGVSSMNTGAHESIQRMSFQKDNREFLTIKFMAFKSGPRVTYVNYKLKDKSINIIDFRDIAISKFGAPFEKEDKQNSESAKRSSDLRNRVHRRIAIQQVGDADEELIAKTIQYLSGLNSWKSEKNYSIEGFATDETVALTSGNNLTLKANVNQSEYERKLLNAANAIKKPKPKTSF